MRNRVLVFDSGLGGLTVARAIRGTAPEIDLIYAADNVAFPYGDWREKPLVRRIVSITGRLIADVEPDCVVIACNTASTLALARLREAFDIPFIGTVPAIKPAAEQTRSGMIGVLATPGTIRRDYTKTLIHTYAYHCRVYLHGPKHLAQMAESHLAGNAIDTDRLRSEIGSVFKERGGARTDTVVLGCTHYPLLLEKIKQAAPWPVTFIDPAPAIARRVFDIMPAPRQRTGSIAPDTVLFSGEVASSATLGAYQAFGFTMPRILAETV